MLPLKLGSAAQLLFPMKLVCQVTFDGMTMLVAPEVILTGTETPFFQIRHELPLNETVQRVSSPLDIAPSAVHLPVMVPPVKTERTRSFSMPDLETTTFPVAAPFTPRSIIRSHDSAVVPKLASKSIVIPVLNWLVVMSGKSMNGPEPLFPPLNSQAPVRESRSNTLGTVADLMAFLEFPDKSLTVVVGPNEFKSEAL